jgi:DNA/RNA-binding domain of Phe-tRNA-synthetase-like protein
MAGRKQVKSNIKYAAGMGLNNVRIGLVEAESVLWSHAPSGRFAAIVDLVRSQGELSLPPGRKAAVRAMLRHGSYKPAGRAKPSSEYLLQAALEGEFPSVNHLVDAANIASLTSGYPISIIDTDKSGYDLLLRRGFAGEGYVFNAGGQRIDLEDLLCVCRQNEGEYIPTANPVRDSMATKIFEDVRNVCAIIYAPKGSEGEDLDSTCSTLGSYLGEISQSVCWNIVEP